MKRLYIETYGCQMNVADTELMLGVLDGEGFVQTQTGGTLSETLENLADVIRKRAALKSRGHAMTAEARTSSAILAILPFLTGGMLYALNPSYMMILFIDPTGKMFFSAAVISLLLGVLTIRAIIKSVLP